MSAKTRIHVRLHTPPYPSARLIRVSVRPLTYPCPSIYLPMTVSTPLHASPFTADVRDDAYAVAWERELKLPWREACSPNHHDDVVDSNQQVVKKRTLLSEDSSVAQVRADAGPDHWEPTDYSA